jgi:uncharacterized protein YkwD
VFAQQPDRAAAKKGFEYLQKIRANPPAYSKEIGANLNKIKPALPIKWNKTLAQVAEAKAMDMAKRNYFDHVNPEGEGINILIHRAGYILPEKWIADKKSNYFESLSAGRESIIEAIQDLILDKSDPDLGHRKHLLGIDPFQHNMTDCGIGFVVAGANAAYQTYCCIILAKQK